MLEEQSVSESSWIESQKESRRAIEEECASDDVAKALYATPLGRVPWTVPGNKTFLESKLDQIQTMHDAHSELMRLSVNTCDQCGRRHPDLTMSTVNSSYCDFCAIEMAHPDCEILTYSTRNKMQLMPHDVPLFELAPARLIRTALISKAQFIFSSLRPIEIACIRLATP